MWTFLEVGLYATYNYFITNRLLYELFKYLKSQKGFEGFGNGPKALAISVMLKSIDKDYKNNPEIKWNFTKFLVDRNGNVVERFEPTHNMKDLTSKVERLIVGE